MKQVWQAADNTIHMTQRDCELHEAKAAHKGTILGYLKKQPDLYNPSIEEVLDALLLRYTITLK